MKASNRFRILAAVVIAASGILVLLAHAKSPAAPAAASAPRDGWPDTRPGAVGRKWLAAFAAGDSAMRAFYTEEMTSESLQMKPAGERLTNYRKLRERVGTLAFGSVVESAPSELKVKLFDADAHTHTFVFTLQNAAPYKLLTIGMIERRSHGFGGFHH